MTRRILVPIDGSPLSRKALRHALADVPDGSITVLHVADLFDPDDEFVPGKGASYEPMIGSDEWYEQADTVATRLFEEAQELATEYDRDVTTESDIGDPARIIVDFTTDEDIDHVVLGTHGRPRESRVVFGSVAETVARRSPVPVTLVRYNRPTGVSGRR